MECISINTETFQRDASQLGRISILIQKVMGEFMMRKDMSEISGISRPMRRASPTQPSLIIKLVSLGRIALLGGLLLSMKKRTIWEGGEMRSPSEPETPGKDSPAGLLGFPIVSKTFLPIRPEIKNLSINFIMREDSLIEFMFQDFWLKNELVQN